MSEYEQWPPIWVKLKPAPPTMAAWARKVDEILKEKRALDRKAAAKKSVVMCRKNEPSAQAGPDPAGIPKP